MLTRHGESSCPQCFQTPYGACPKHTAHWYDDIEPYTDLAFLLLGLGALVLLTALLM